MLMKGPLAYLFAFVILFCGCSNEEDILPDQEKRIVSYLTSIHLPRLVAVDQTGGNPVAFYSTMGNSVYRYIDVNDFYNPDRVNQPVVGGGSRVTITFSAYVFTYANIVTAGDKLTAPYFTNDSALRQPLINAGLTVDNWSFEPLVIDMSKQDIIKGLHHALLGCRKGDHVEAYMTYNMAYGKDNFSVIPRESPIALFFTVDSVE